MTPEQTKLQIVDRQIQRSDAIQKQEETAAELREELAQARLNKATAIALAILTAGSVLFTAGMAFALDDNSMPPLPCHPSGQCSGDSERAVKQEVPSSVTDDIGSPKTGTQGSGSR